MSLLWVWYAYVFGDCSLSGKVDEVYLPDFQYRMFVVHPTDTNKVVKSTVPGQGISPTITALGLKQTTSECLA